MNTIPFESAGWYRALTLAERASILAQEVPADPPAQHRERARRRRELWRAQPPFDRDGHLLRRLTADGLDEPTFHRLLEVDEATLRRHATRPDWLARLAGELAGETPSPEPPTDAAEAEAPGPASVLWPFHALLDTTRRTFRSRAAEVLSRATADLGLDPERADRLLRPLLFGRLTRMVNRTIVLELHAARLEGGLAGDSPEARFRSFLEQAARPATLVDLLHRYPVLARALTRASDQWVAFAVDVLAHLVDDAAEIHRRFGAAPEPVEEIKGANSDHHRGGRTVLFLRFGSGLRLVYKPRPLAVEARFQELLAWTERRGFRPALRRLAVLDRRDHGWVERVDADPCADPEAVTRFYERQGGLLALLAALEGTDFHHENVIAAGEHPVAVDLESLFHPGLSDWEGDAEAGTGAVLYPSVLRVGLLPERIWAEDGGEGIDISGLGGESGQMSPRPVPQIDGHGTDEMRFVRRRAQFPETANRPRLADGDVDPTEHGEALAAGYARMARLLGRHAAELVAPDGAVAAFADAEVRAIARPTRTYSTLLLESFHPHVLADALDRDRLFDRLWAAVDDRGYLERLIPAERTALERGDVPVFFTRPGSRDLWTDEAERWPGFFAESGLDRVAERLQALADGSEVERHLYLLRGSMAAAAFSRRSAERWAALRLEPAAAPAPPERYLDAALALGERLGKRAIPIDAEEVAWFELAPVPGTGGWSFHPLGPELYGGLSGIALFLAHLGALTSELGVTEMAQRAWASALSLHARFPDGLSSVGAFAGEAGLLYAQAHLGLLWRDEAMVTATAERCAGLAERIARDDRFDVIAGSAGCALVLLGLDRRFGGDAPTPFLDLAVRCGDRLLDGATVTAEGTGWLIPGTGDRPLTGLSHGAAGIAWALLELAAATGDERFRRAGLDAIRYERSLYLPEQRNWPDLRDAAILHRGRRRSVDGEPCEVAWCHGAAGIGLARLACLPHLGDDPEARREIETAIATTLAEGISGNHSLCHGALGNLDLLRSAGEATCDEGLLAAVARYGAASVASLEAGEPFFGFMLGADVPGLMLGLAGIGYGLLRLAAPDRVPSVLQLELPAAGGPA
jgi:type 2 lantibiotic biosynthesis protein LanM